MRTVIDIPEDVILNDTYTQYFGCMSKKLDEVLHSGLILPKGHGRLIDADALNARMEQRINEIGDDRSIWEASGVETALDMFAPTIIEADKENDTE